MVCTSTCTQKELLADSVCSPKSSIIGMCPVHKVLERYADQQKHSRGLPDQKLAASWNQLINDLGACDKKLRKHLRKHRYCSFPRIPFSSICRFFRDF